MAVLAALLFPVIVNVVNFMDGINGISGAVLVVWGVAAVILGTSVGLGALTTLGAMSLGAALGFLPWNVPDARLFLGDSGSYLMGGIIAAGATISVPQDVPLGILLSPLALYVGDVALTLARRRHRGQPLLEAHKDHAYQRLVSVAGISHPKVASVVFVASALILSAWVLLPITLGLVVTVVVTGVFLGLPHFAESRS
ncbi:hypothetical protein UB45_01965 [Terrabacter sp. 28]|nr:hypothetical protein UB45_01965 [Terrabacter sp. 28]